MGFDTNWDVDKYKSDFESEDHWKLRRDFMSAHKMKFPEDRLVCLAQVFFNVEFMGCKYPQKTMKLIEELSLDIAAEHREQKKHKLQRTFVKASDAAGAKIKGTKRPAENDSSAPKEKIKCLSSDDNIQHIEDTIGNKFEACSTSNPAALKQQESSRQKYNNFTVENKTSSITMEEIQKIVGPFGNVVVFYKIGESPHSVIQRFASQWKLELRQTLEVVNNKWEASIHLNEIEVGKASDTVKSTALQTALRKALDMLMETYFTVRIKYTFFGDSVVDTSTTEEVDKNSSVSDIDKPMDEDNIGQKLLKLMGWSGGGLGKNEQGIINPVKASGVTGRAGLGNSGDDFAELSRVRKLIVEYQNSNDYHDLVFSPRFSKEQRQKFHEFAKRRNLKTKSYGNGNKRHLVISKKIGIWKIIEGLVENSEQFYNRYELVRPGKHNE